MIVSSSGNVIGQNSTDFNSSTGFYIVPKTGKYLLGGLWRDTYTSNLPTGYSNRAFIHVTNSLGTRKTLAFVAESSWTPEGSGSGSFVANLVESDEVSWHTSFGGTVPPFTWCTAYVHYIGPT